MIKKSQKGMTPIELLVVVVILIVLILSIFMVFDPKNNLKDVQNATRKSTASSILVAVHSCLLNSKGDLSTCGINDNAKHTLGTVDLDLSQTGVKDSRNNPTGPKNRHYRRHRLLHSGKREQHYYYHSR